MAVIAELLLARALPLAQLGIEAVEGPAVALALAQEIDFSFWSLFARATLANKIVLLILIGASVWAWAIIIQKLIDYRRARADAAAFDRAGFEAARKRRLEVSGKPEQYDDLSVFEREQQAMRELCERSAMPVIEIDVAPGEEVDAAEQIAGHLQLWKILLIGQKVPNLISFFHRLFFR